MQQTLRSLIARPWFEPLVIALIVINAITLAFETSPSVMAAVGPALLAFDRFILGLFVIEILIRLAADPKGFWRDPWRLFDLTIIVIALIPASGAFSVLRAFRILRLLRLISAVPAMRRVVAGLLAALPGMGSIVMLLGLIFFVFSVISTKLFSETFPEWFGTLGASAYTLFQIMTLESWSMGIVRPVMEAYPLSWALFVPFIIMTAFAVLNLFIGVIVDAMQSEHAADAHSEREALQQENARILAELTAIRADLAKLTKQDQS